ncbi:MAG TPA: C39 family peptidase [Anaerolineales bacterium]
MFKTQNLYQNDPAWKSTRLGDSSETIGSWGCLLTSVTMMLNGIGYSETPQTVNQKMKAAGGFQGAFFIPSVLPYVFSNSAYRDMEPCQSRPAPIDRIDAALAAGKPVIAQVDWNKEAGIQTHFVLLKEKKGSDYALYDPYMYSGDGPDKEVLLTSRYNFQGKTADSEISAVLWFDAISNAPQTPPKVNKVPVPAVKFFIYAAEDDLALRAEPSVDGYLWKRMLARTQLTCLESKSSVKTKIGKQGQWIHVQDPKGDQGYVAAWYVSEQKPAAPKPATPGADPASTMTNAVPAGSLALVPTQELAFRTQPVISPDTLIRRIPVTEQLICVEPSSQAIPKIGVTGQWVRVRDSAKKEGVVAAWYVKYASGATAQKSAPPAGSGPVKVRASCEAVALRSQPAVSDATLIKRVPINYEFTIVEPGGAAKVGSNNQWIKVRDTAGTEGYVAAWFVGF